MIDHNEHRAWKEG